ncbi:MAG: tetratricopeptide repeat protein [Chloroflexi bacterium]|nr:tetratricopeptide repeat protein [Chloroflexota bacterium]MBP8056429.1 tetratricopeptide repeat protein [Chloroflexota bacterium]
MRRYLFLLTLLLFLLVACGGNEPDSPLTPIFDGPTRQATPTLAPGLAAATQNFPPTPAAVIPRPGQTPLAPTPNPTLLASPTTTATPSPAPTPTATPDLAQRQTLAQVALHNQDYDLAIEHLEILLASGTLTPADQRQTLYQAGLAYQAAGRLAEAAEAFNLYLAQNAAAPTAPTSNTTDTAVAYFHLGEILRTQGDCPGAIGAYQSYLAANPDMAAYVQPLIGDCYLLLDDRSNAITAYENALTGQAHRLIIVPIRQKLADFYREDSRYAEAIAQYDAIIAVAQTEFTKGQMTYLAGQTHLLAGDQSAAYQRFLTGVREYPGSYDSYEGLVVLVEANVPVDDFQRGLVNYNAGQAGNFSTFYPAIEAFNRVITANPESYREDVHLYLAWSYEGLGDMTNALDQLEQYRAISLTTAAPGLLEKAALLARNGQTLAALEAYNEFVTTLPQEVQASEAAYQVAVLTEEMGRVQDAAAAYQQMATSYPTDENAPYALFRAGWLYEEMNATEPAITAWRQLAEQYPTSEWGAAALIWLLRVVPEAEQGALRDAAANASVFSYYGLRARDLAQGIDPFTREGTLTLTMTGQAEAENWLRQALELDASYDLSQLGPTLAQDERLIRGEKLWQLGLYEAAKRELEAVRETNSNDTQASYQLALWFRDLGLYRSSILAVNAVLRLTNTTIFTAPAFIGQLSYPTYYTDLILPLAEYYDYDPLIQFSLLRQESLFEGFAQSSAYALGLSQVIPDTAYYIADRLAWPDFDVLDLYQPHVGLAFGAFYLDEQLRLFDGFVPAAISAYNAGPGNALHWYEQAGDDLDLYIESVSFWETRLYIERIYSGYVIYRYLYGG